MVIVEEMHLEYTRRMHGNNYIIIIISFVAITVAVINIITNID